MNNNLKKIRESIKKNNLDLFKNYFNDFANKELLDEDEKDLTDLTILDLIYQRSKEGNGEKFLKIYNDVIRNKGIYY